MIQDRQELIRAYWILLLSFFILIFIAGLTFFINKSLVVLLEVLLLLPLLFHVNRNKIRLAEAVRWKPVSLRTGILSAIVGSGVAIVVDEMNRLIQMVVPMNEMIRSMNETLVWHSWPEGICLFTGGVIVAALTEESLFRGFFQRIAENHYGPTKGVMMTALLFALFHIQPFIAELVTYGLILGILCWKTGSMIPPVVAHAVINCMTLLFANLKPEKLLHYEWGGHVAPIWILAGILMAAGGMIGIFRISENKKMNPLRGAFV